MMEVYVEVSLFPKSDASIQKFQKELNSGMIGLVVLAVLDRCGELYGYDIVRQLTNDEETPLPMNQSAVYPVLRSLEKQDLLSSRMQPSEVGPPRKYYQMTKKGRAVFLQWKQLWNRSVDVVNRILTEKNHDHSTGTSGGCKVPS